MTKRQDYRFTQTTDMQVLSQEEEKTEAQVATQRSLRCLFLLRFNIVGRKNIVCQLDETEKVHNE